MIAAAHHIAPAPRTGALSIIAFSAPVMPVAAIAAAFPAEPLVTWSSSDLAIAGIGIARELRGHGSKRWSEIIAATPPIVSIASTTIDGTPAPLDTLGFARPRFLGGAAFAPGAADRAPWTGFGDAWFVLPRWTYVSNGVRAFFVLATDGDTTWQAELARLRAIPTSYSASQPNAIDVRRASAGVWREQVTSITDAIANGDYAKVVAARTCNVELAGPIDAAALLAALDDRHADCVRVLVRPPNAATLVAATPERLVRVDGRAVQCDALAGTTSIEPSLEEARARLLASTKDRREHDLVVAAIRTALDDAGAVRMPDMHEMGSDPIFRETGSDPISASIRTSDTHRETGSDPFSASVRTSDTHRETGSDPFSATVRMPDMHEMGSDPIFRETGSDPISVRVSEPAVRVLRHVLHLHTPFRALLSERRHVLELVARLHPTPAVGGTPTTTAVEWIASREPVARGWYASPVGWFDLDGNGEFAVAIRSGVLAGERAHLWAGAGIVAGSDPERELAETDAKFRAMLGALGVSA